MSAEERDRIRGLRRRTPPAEDAVAPNSQERGETIIEFYKQGSYVRVCAVDVASGIEAAIVGDPSVGEEPLNRIALQKLDYVMRTRRRGL